MIQDHELTDLAGSKSTILQGLGFAGLGGALGLAGPFLMAFAKVSTTPPQALSAAELFYLVAFSGTVVLTLVCLIMAAFEARSKKSLAETIRKRPKIGHGMAGR
jgi:hypothetical protein